MKRIRTHYDNLKVVRNAPLEVIRAAYKTLSQKYHPDRNPDNPDAARIMMIINTAYEELSDPAKRKHHDEWIESQEQNSSSQPKAPESSSQAYATLEFEPPKAGTFAFGDLPTEVKERLKRRIGGSNQEQLAVKTGGVVWNYVWAILISGWFVYLFGDAAEYRWDKEDSLWMLGFTVSAAFLLSKNLSWIVRWHLSPLHCWLIVSPLYVIKTEPDRVWYWPIWSISNIRRTHNYRNGVYQGTSLEMSFDGNPESFTITPESVYSQVVSALQKFDASFRAAVAKGGVDYILENDDFAECHAKISNQNPPKITKTMFFVFVAIFAFSAISFSAAYVYNSDRPYKPVNSHPNAARVIIPYNSTQPTPKPSYVRSSTAPNGQPWPATAAYVPGYKKLHTNGLSSVTIDNMENDSDVFVKLVYLGGAEAFPVRMFFVPANSRFTVGKVRTGTYDIRYRDLDSGALARSESFRLEETPTYGGVEYSNITMTLYKVRNGNMQTYAISESEF